MYSDQCVYAFFTPLGAHFFDFAAPVERIRARVDATLGGRTTSRHANDPRPQTHKCETVCTTLYACTRPASRSQETSKKNAASSRFIVAYANAPHGHVPASHARLHARGVTYADHVFWALFDPHPPTNSHPQQARLSLARAAASPPANPAQVDPRLPHLQPRAPFACRWPSKTTCSRPLARCLRPPPSVKGCAAPAP